ncbi:helix-turn-helix domain-containing protein [Flavobacterium sp. XGLA_31]|uniref:helix-turn-helix domain-containing protein n=1 Tax=Flavobacterium sp. XGLA_31 TaxID=3447666 RepID=UPI003F33BB46
MNYRCVSYRYLLIVILVGCLHTVGIAQNFAPQDYLSENIENLINSNPDQALKIAQHLLSKTNTTNQEKAKINFFISKAYKVKGDYSSALNFLFEEKNFDQYLSEETKIDIEIEKADILRELALDKQSKKILQQLETKGDNLRESDLKSYIKSAVTLQKARFLFSENKFDKALELLNNKDIFSEKIFRNREEFKLTYQMTLGQLYLGKKDLVHAKSNFDSVMKVIKQQDVTKTNIYAKINAFCGLAGISFLENDHNNVILLSSEALVDSKRLGNWFLQEKIMRLETESYIALQDSVHYKVAYTEFIEARAQAESQEQDGINASYNLISDEYNEAYLAHKENYQHILYYVGGVILIIILICLFFWVKVLQSKKRLDEIINYIEITRNNLVERFTEKKPEPKKNTILKETEDQLLIKLKKFENSKRFINKDISLAVLAGQLDSNTKYLSEIINSHYNVNFNTYINKLRINYIIEKLKTDPNFINYKISYLAENCGFSSHSSFATVFKSITGMSPVKFIELLNDEKENNLLNDAS